VTVEVSRKGDKQEERRCGGAMWGMGWRAHGWGPAAGGTEQSILRHHHSSQVPESGPACRQERLRWGWWGVPWLRPGVDKECFIPSFSLLETNLLLGAAAPSLEGWEHTWSWRAQALTWDGRRN